MEVSGLWQPSSAPLLFKVSILVGTNKKNNSDDIVDRLQVDAICVFVHGRGQSPEEMQSHVLARLDAPDVAFVLPRAESGSWYDARAIDPLTAGTRTALQAALDQLAGDVAEARAAFGELPLLLAGFSQGACLASIGRTLAARCTR